MIVDKALIGAFTTSNGKSLADVVALQVGNIGENMALRRAVHLKGGNSSIASYVHTSGTGIMSLLIYYPLAVRYITICQYCKSEHIFFNNGKDKTGRFLS